MFSREYYFDKLTPPVIAMARSAIANLLTGGNYREREEAKYALENLKKMLAEYHWATARVYLVRSYGRFWYEEVGKSLCAPGGKWAENDRAAFEAEFSHLSQ